MSERANDVPETPEERYPHIPEDLHAMAGWLAVKILRQASEVAKEAGDLRALVVKHPWSMSAELDQTTTDAVIVSGELLMLAEDLFSVLLGLGPGELADFYDDDGKAHRRLNRRKALERALGIELHPSK